MLKKLKIIFPVLLLILFAAGCTKLTANREDVCRINFDYTDNGINDQNAYALLEYYCLCNPETETCKDLTQ